MHSVTKAYLAACAAPDSPLRTAGRQLPLAPYFGSVYSRQLARPMFVPEAHLRRAADDLRALHAILQSLPDRRFGGDVRALCAALGMPPCATAFAVAAAGHGSTPLYGRPDLYYDGDSFTLLELNTGSELGGVDFAEVNEAFLRIPAFADFAGQHQLGYTDTGVEIAAYLRDLAAPITGGADPVVAMIDISENMHKYAANYRSFVAHMAARGIQVLVTHIADVRTRDGKLTVDGTPIDVAMRYFTLEEICADPRAEEWLTPVLRADEAGRTAFFAGLDHGIYANKGVLALVSQMREAGDLTPVEAEVVDRILPWTRTVTSELRGYAHEHRERLLLKPAAGGSGAGVVAGWTASPESWADAFEAALTKPYVLQARVEGMVEDVPGDDGVTSWLPAYGMFVFAQGYAGCFVRALPVDGGAVINDATGASITTVFAIPGG